MHLWILLSGMIHEIIMLCAHISKAASELLGLIIVLLALHFTRVQFPAFGMQC